jgi:hypothetical protein
VENDDLQRRAENLPGLSDAPNALLDEDELSAVALYAPPYPHQFPDSSRHSSHFLKLYFSNLSRFSLKIGFPAFHQQIKNSSPQNANASVGQGLEGRGNDRRDELDKV